MKKKSLLFAFLLVVSLSLTACKSQTQDTQGQTDTTDTTVSDSAEDTSVENSNDADQTTEISSVDILSKVWATYGEADKFYAMGGDMANPVENAPGNYSLADTEALAATLLVQSDQLAMIDEAASLIHGMNTNVFTGAVFHLTDPANAETFAKGMEENIIHNQWMCGSPDRYALYLVNGEYVMMAFGAVDVMKTYEDKVAQVYEGSMTVLAQGNVAQ